MNEDGRLRCEEFVTTARWYGECGNPAKYGVYVRGSGRWTPLCGVHIRRALAWESDIVPMADLRPETVAAMKQAGRVL